MHNNQSQLEHEMRTNSSSESSNSRPTATDQEQMTEEDEIHLSYFPSNVKSQIPEANVDQLDTEEHDGTCVRHHTSRAILQPLIIFQGNGVREVVDQQTFLYQAAMRGDWKAVEVLLRGNPRLTCVSVNQSGDTILHIAAGAKRTKFVRELVKLMSSEELELRNDYENTAFCSAAASGVVEIAKVMYEKNNNLPRIRGRECWTPLSVAALRGRKEMVSYLYTITPSHILGSSKEWFALLEAAVHMDMFDLALKILNDAGSIAGITSENKASILLILARKPDSFIGQDKKWMPGRLFLDIAASLQYISWMRRVHNDILKQMAGNKLLEKLLTDILALPHSEFQKQLNKTGILHDAVKVGNVEFLAMLFRSYPELILLTDGNGHSIFHFAVKHRRENVFNLIYDLGAHKDLVVLSEDNDDNNILHLAAAEPTKDRLEAVSGAALQMQRELLWFKGVENILPPSYLERRNKKNRTPREVFTEEHKSLLEKGEKWMKDTANSCVLVATLVAALVFAAAFAVPAAGSDTNTGRLPVFLGAGWFEVFVISDVVGMFTSTTSIITFLSILTSRYAEQHFLTSLPTKLTVGLTSLFLSILSMVVVFTATFFLIHKEERVWVPRVIVGAFACGPIIDFAMLEYELWIDTIWSTYWSKSLFRPSKHKLY